MIFYSCHNQICSPITLLKMNLKMKPLEEKERKLELEKKKAEEEAKRREEELAKQRKLAEAANVPIPQNKKTVSQVTEEVEVVIEEE